MKLLRLAIGLFAALALVTTAVSAAPGPFAPGKSHEQRKPYKHHHHEQRRHHQQDRVTSRRANIANGNSHAITISNRVITISSHASTSSRTGHINSIDTHPTGISYAGISTAAVITCTAAQRCRGMCTLL